MASTFELVEKTGDDFLESEKEGRPDQIDCMSLSSGSNSSSLLSFDGWRSEDEQFSSLSGSKSSWVFLDGEISIFDGSRISPIEEASLVLDVASENTEEIFEEDLQAEVVTWLYNSVGHEIRESLIACSESSYEPSDSSVFESSWPSLSTEDDGSSSGVSDFDGTGIWVSLLDLEEEDLELLSDKERRFDLFESDFPSPSFNKLKQNFEIGFSSSHLRISGDENSGFNSPLCGGNEGDLGGNDTEEPLFWPFDRISYLHAESNGLCISPRKNIRTLEKLCSSKSIRLRFHGINKKSMNLKEGCTRKILFGSRPTTVLDSKDRDGSNQSMGSSSLSSKRSCSRLSGSIRSSSNRPVKMKDVPSSRRQLPSRSPNLKVFVQFKLDLSVEDYHRKLLECIGSDEEAPIETLVGLNEFDGHEGIDIEFEEGGFSLDRPVCEILKNGSGDGCDNGSLCTPGSSSHTGFQRSN